MVQNLGISGIKHNSSNDLSEYETANMSKLGHSDMVN